MSLQEWQKVNKPYLIHLFRANVLNTIQAYPLLMGNIIAAVIQFFSAYPWYSKKENPPANPNVSPPEKPCSCHKSACIVCGEKMFCRLRCKKLFVNVYWDDSLMVCKKCWNSTKKEDRELWFDAATGYIDRHIIKSNDQTFGTRNNKT